MKSKIENRDFVVAWMTSESLDEIVKTTGMKKPAIQQRAKYLRDKGVSLPKLKRTVTLDRLEVAQLNSMIQKYQKQAQS